MSMVVALLLDGDPLGAGLAFKLRQGVGLHYERARELASEGNGLRVGHGSRHCTGSQFHRHEMYRDHLRRERGLNLVLRTDAVDDCEGSVELALVRHHRTLLLAPTLSAESQKLIEKRIGDAAGPSSEGVADLHPPSIRITVRGRKLEPAVHMLHGNARA
ncbi:hypothetical protein [Sphingomonas solaris]|uniref:Uncharacterized protein n=1 Tax=Alterirhizorhabdus solaris TaxID=2529389 RepID=A0A558R9H5_9SPHN|nr:hypothetical protein [Sphingomonas solaris]TVV76035.1 hypothetical protein FOY91_05500 [Sphingomonas solaris]